MKINNFRNCFTHKSGVKTLTFVCLSGLTALGLIGCSDNDFDSVVNNLENGTAVAFNVGVAGDNTQTTRALTRAAYADQLSDFGLKPEDLVDQKLAVEGNSDYCLVETTLPGIYNEDFKSNPATRADIITTATLGKFSAIGSRGASASALSSWFHNEEVGANGTFKNTFYWAMSQPYAKFYAVYPQITDAYDKLALSSQGTSVPYVNVQVETDATNQKDLMTACSGETPIQYVTQGTAPVVPIKFQHAMTAIRFKLGENVAAGHNITKIEIVDALSKGKFTLPSGVLLTSTGDLDRAWTDVKDKATFKVDGLNVSTSGTNKIITGRDNNDNYTFYMIPQSLAGVRVNIYFDNAGTPAITAALRGSWKAGTTKTYELSQKAGSFEYVLNPSSPGIAAKDATTTSTYMVQSYITENGVKKPLKWKVVDYKVNGASVAKPEWLTNLTLEGGNGSTTSAGETGTATITQNVKDLLKERNEGLQKATAVTNYNLSNKTGADAIENTANSYVISAPGTYRIPLVYGNAIKGGSTNESAYISKASSVYLPKDGGGFYDEDLVLHKFVDHLDREITSPYINVQNRSYAAKLAEVVWTDVPGVVSNLEVKQNGGDKDFLTFTVNENQLANGNTIVAVTDDSGKVLWSWHLWFAPKTALDPIKFTSAGTTYNFTNETLGWKYTKWMAKTEARKVTVVIEQEGSGKKGEIEIEQAGDDAVREGYCTLYQWGRKDALPGVDNISGYSYESSYQKIPDQAEHNEPYRTIMLGRTIGRGICNPGVMLPEVGAGKLGWQYKQYINLWSINSNTIDGLNSVVVKTIYDPSPVGYQMPNAYVFKDFNTTDATWDNGYTLRADNNKEIYFPACGARSAGKLVQKNVAGFYWTGVAVEVGGQLGYAWRAKMANGSLSLPVKNSDARNAYSYAFGVRPVASPTN